MGRVSVQNLTSLSKQTTSKRHFSNYAKFNKTIRGKTPFDREYYFVREECKLKIFSRFVM